MSALPRDVINSNVVNDRNRGAELNIAGAFCTTCSLLFLGTRVIIRWPLSSLWSSDDWVTTVATMVAVMQMIVTLEAVSHGLGKIPEDVSESALRIVLELIYASDLLFVFTIYASKFATVMLFYRLWPLRDTILYLHAMSFTCGIFCITSILILGIQHPFSSPWLSAIAGTRVVRWAVVEGLSNLLDFAIIIFPTYLVSDLHTKRRTKAKVIFGFSLRFLSTPVSIIRLVSFAYTTSNRSLSLYTFVIPEILLQVEMHYQVISATTPCLRTFLKVTSTGLLADPIGIDPSTTQLATTYGRRRTGGSYLLSTFKSERSKNGRNDNDSSTVRLTGRRHGETVTTAAREEGGGRQGEDNDAASDSSQQAIIVRQTVTVRHSQL